MIKNYKISGLYFSIILGLVLAINANAVAKPVTFSEDTTVQLTIRSALASFTITANSTAESVTVNDDNTITVVITSGESFTLESGDMYVLNDNNGDSYTNSCNPNQTSLTLAPSSTVTVIITPDPTTVTSRCGNQGTSGGGSGGGVTYNYTPTPTPTPTSTPMPSPSVTTTILPLPSTIIATPAPAPVSGAAAKLYRKIGDSKIYVQNSDGSLIWIKTLQEFNAAGYKWSNVQVVSAKSFAKLQTVPVTVGGKIKVVSRIKYLNIRSLPSTAGKIVGKAASGLVYEFTSIQNGWYKINSGWISGIYVTKVK